MAVTRIESQKTTGQYASLSDAQRHKAVELILRTMQLRNVLAIQIDFDATSSERDFYRALLHDVRAKLPDNLALSMTALASFCVGDRWLCDLPVDEAVPMIFRMGADDRTIKNFLSSGEDFREPLCQKSYGIAVDEPLDIQFKPGRRVYVFNDRSWKPSDVDVAQRKDRAMIRACMAAFRLWESNATESQLMVRPPRTWKISTTMSALFATELVKPGCVIRLPQSV